jgi:Domain of unknown function (DUF4424)
MHSYRSALLAGAALLFASQSLADDSSAALGMGGVVLTQTADIRMAKEDLYVSPAKVRIHFEFANDSAKDIDTVVAFPLPDIDASVFFEEPIGTITEDPVNFVGFTVTADGKHIVPQVEQRAIYKGRDVTALLASLHIPVNVIAGRNNQLMLHLAPAQIQALHAAGLSDAESGDGEHPHWTIRTKFWWKQKFPAGKTVVLDHTYQPVTGQTFYGTYDLAPANARDDGNRHWDTKFCIDPATHKSLAARIGAKASDPNTGGSMLAYTTDYILMSGNNWKGPIGHFHLTLDKQKPDNVLSLCWDGNLRKTGATTFDFTQDNFAPPRDIHLLVLQDITKGG